MIAELLAGYVLRYTLYYDRSGLVDGATVAIVLLPSNWYIHVTVVRIIVFLFLQGLLYKSGTYYKDSLRKFSNKGITTAAILCNNERAINTCNSYDFDRVFQEFIDMGVTLLYILKLDVTAGEDYHLNMTTAVQRLIADDIDLVIIHDFKILCMDFIPEAKSVDWTPRALYLNLCGQDVTAMAELGTDVCDLTVKLKCIAGLLESMSYSSVNAISCRCLQQ